MSGLLRRYLEPSTWASGAGGGGEGAAEGEDEEERAALELRRDRLRRKLPHLYISRAYKSYAHRQLSTGRRDASFVLGAQIHDAALRRPRARVPARRRAARARARAAAHLVEMAPSTRSESACCIHYFDLSHQKHRRGLRTKLCLVRVGGVVCDRRAGAERRGP